MTTVKLGSNEFTDVQVLIAFKGRPVLIVADHPLRVTLQVPEAAPQFAPRVEIVENVAPGNPRLRISSTPDAVTVLFDSQPICIATKVRSDEIVLRIDLRPIGMLVYDDAHGLHVGNSIFAKNIISKAHTAFNLA